MSNKILLFILVCVFFVCLSPTNASEGTYSINYSNNDQFESISNLNEIKNDEKDLNNLALEVKSSSNNLAVAEKKSSESSNLAAGENKPSKISQSSILNASVTISNYISKNGKLPNNVEISGYKFSMPEYLYLVSKTIQNLFEKKDAQIKVKYNVKDPKKPVGTNIKMEVSSNSYYKYATRVANFISKHSTAPNFLNLGSSKIQYQTLIYAFAEAIVQSKDNDNKLPSSIYFNVKKTSKLNSYIPNYSIASKSKTVSSKKLNIYYNGESLAAYLSSSKNCQVNDKKIQSLSYEITKNYKTKYDKANAIFNWVRDKVSYKFYYNTKLGAKKTMINKSGNCVDQAHLIVALSRASGIASRYVHGKCDFIVSGKTYGHVWAQVKVGNMWYVADSTSSKNSLGVVNSWNTSSYTFNGIYSSLSF